MLKTLFWRPEKNDQVARIGGRGEGGVKLIRAMPETKHDFPYDVFPNSTLFLTALALFFWAAKVLAAAVALHKVNLILTIWKSFPK